MSPSSFIHDLSNSKKSWESSRGVFDLGSRFSFVTIRSSHCVSPFFTSVTYLPKRSWRSWVSSRAFPCHVSITAAPVERPFYHCSRQMNWITVGAFSVIPSNASLQKLTHTTKRRHPKRNICHADDGCFKKVPSEAIQFMMKSFLNAWTKSEFLW